MKGKFTLILLISFLLLSVWQFADNALAQRTIPPRRAATPTPAVNKQTDSAKNSVGMQFVSIAAGEFRMGSNYGEADEKPVHTVRLTQGFQMQTTEVTQAQWKAVMGSMPTECEEKPLNRDFVGDNKPIYCISWNDAQKFIAKLNALNDGFKYRLPSEAEWEYACRAGTTGETAGSLDEMAWYYNNSGNRILNGAWDYDDMLANRNRTHDVATKKPNAWGLYDMYGNVWEYVQDWSDDTYYSKSPKVNPTGAASGASRVIRGGGWSSDAPYVRSPDRGAGSVDEGADTIGFRVVRQ